MDSYAARRFGEMAPKRHTDRVRSRVGNENAFTLHVDSGRHFRGGIPRRAVRGARAACRARYGSPERPVIDPESGLDAVRNVGIVGGSIQSVSQEKLRGKLVFDTTGLVVAPGLIDLHQDDQDAENYPLKAMDGVTTVLKMVNGTA